MAPGKLLTVALVLAMFTVFGYAADGPPVRHVVLVSVDGLAASYLDDPRAEMAVFFDPHADTAHQQLLAA